MKKLTRRSFMQQGSAVALAGTAGLTFNQPPAKKIKNMFIHHVYFYLKEPGNTAHRDKLLEGLQALSAVKTIKQFHIGKPANTKREVIDSTYALSWMLMFDNDTDQESYQTDPVHLKFVADYSHLWSTVKVYDTVDI